MEAGGQQQQVQAMEEGGQQHQQQQVVIHRAILNGIARCLADRRRRCDQRHTIYVIGVKRQQPRVVTRRSLELLVDFLDNGGGGPQHQVTKLELGTIRLLSNNSNPPPGDHGGLDTLRGLFARSDTSLTRIRLFDCDFGTAQEALHLLSAFESNRTILDLTISGICNLEGTAALGNSLCALLQQNTTLQRLKYRGSLLVAGILALQLGLRTNQTLKELSLPFCGIGNEGIRLLTDGLVGNTTLEVLDIRNNRITSTGLVDITRLIDSTRLQKIDAGGNRGILNDDTRIVAPGLRLRPYLKELTLPFCGIGNEGIRRLADGLVGNTTMQVLDISNNGITSAGLVDIRRLIDSTRLQKIGFIGSDSNVFDNKNTMREFVATLNRSSTVQELLGVTDVHDLPGNTYSTVNTILVRNKSLNHVGLLLSTPPPPPPTTCHKAIVKFASLPNQTGTSAIFKLLHARPALLEKRRRLKHPPPVAAATRQPPPPPPKRRSCALASATEQASKKKCHTGDGCANANASLPTRQEALNTTTTTTSPTTTASSGTLFEEAKQCIETASGNIKALLEQGDHEQASLLITQQQEAGLNLRRSLLNATLQRLHQRYGL